MKTLEMACDGSEARAFFEQLLELLSDPRLWLFEQPFCCAVFLRAEDEQQQRFELAGPFGPHYPLGTPFEAANRGALAFPLLDRGEEVGLLAVYPPDGKLNVRDMSMVQRVAEVASLGYSRRRQATVLERESGRLRSAIEGTGAGCWDIDLTNGVFRLSERGAEILRLPKGQLTVPSEIIMAMAHPDDLGKQVPNWEAHIAGETPRLDYTARMRAHEDEEWRHVYWAGKIVTYSDSGAPLKASGVFFDASERLAREEALKIALSNVERTLDELSAYRAALDQHALVIIMDRRGVVSCANSKGCEMMGLGQAETLGERAQSLASSDVHEAASFQKLLRALRGGEIWRNDIRNVSHGGEVFWTDTVIVPIARENDKPQKFVCISYDITQRKLAEAAAERRQRAEALISDMQTELITAGSMAFSIHIALEALLPLYDAKAAILWDVQREKDGLFSSSVLALSLTEAEYIDEEAPATFPAGEEGLAPDAAEWIRDVLFRSFSSSEVGARELVGLPIQVAREPIGVLGLGVPAGRAQQIASELAPMLTAIGELLLAQRDTDRRREAEEHALRLARHDVLTGIGNRRFLMEQFDDRIDHPDARFALMLVDLDRFKPINDVHGHLVGDQVLQIIAQRLCNALPGYCAIARLGGDEFAVLTEPHAPESLVREIADRVLQRLSLPIGLNGLKLSVGASVGVAMYPRDAKSAQELLHYADAAMYRAKQQRGAVQFFDAALDEGLRVRAELETKLRKAIEQGQIQPYFQPIVSLQTGKVVSHEVLARWRHEKRGYVPPSTFIPIAEEAGLVDALFWTMLREACRKHAEARASTILSVNLSPYQIKDALFVPRLLQELQALGFPPKLLEIEVTESAMLGDLDRARPVLLSLKNQGVRLALDDFGTGYSSLVLLRDLPFDKVKIDRSFVCGLSDAGDTDSTIIDAVLGIAKALKLEVTAEGIEDAGAARILSQKGCHYGQGYHFGKAIATVEAEIMRVNVA